MGNEKEFQSTITLVKNLPAISMAVVLYNNSLDVVSKLVDNLDETTKFFSKRKLFLINNSPDNQVLDEYLSKIATEKEFIELLRPDMNHGFGAGNNLVLRTIASDYHFVINPDISIPGKEELYKMIWYLEKNQECGLLTPLIKYPDGREQHLLKKESTVLDMGLRFLGLPVFKKRQESFINLPNGYTDIHEAENVPGSFMVFRTDIFQKIKGFDEKYFLYMEDSDITKSVRQIAKVIFFPKATVYHEWQRDNRKSFRGIMTMLRSMFIYFNKWGWKFF